MTLKGEEIEPVVTWGTSPEDVLPITAKSCPSPEDFTGGKVEAARRALDYMGLTPGTPLDQIKIDTVFVGSCTNGRIEDLREVAKILKGRKVAEGVRMMIVPGSGLVREQAEEEGLAEIFKEAGRRLAARRLFDVPGDEPRPARAGGALRLDLEPQLRGPAGLQGPHPPGQPRHGRRGGGDRPPHRRAGAELMEKFKKLTGVAAPMPLVNIDTDMIIPKVFLKTIKRSGLGVNLFDEMRYDREGNEIADFVLNKPPYREARDPRRRRQFRLRLVARACALGAAGFRHPGGRLDQLRRHLLQQLLQERHPADRAAAGAGRQADGRCREGRQRRR